MEPHEMPVREDGVRADIIMDSIPTFNRMNFGRAYEHYIAGASRDLQLRLRDMLCLNKGQRVTEEYLRNVDPEIMSAIWLRISNYLACFGTMQHEWFQNLNEEQLYEYLTVSINDKLRVFKPTDNEYGASEIIRNIEQVEPPVYDKVTYIGNTGVRKAINDKVRIGILNIMLLDKIADDWSSSTSARLQMFGILSANTKSEKFSNPYKSVPGRVIGVTEGRLEASYAGTEAVAERIDRANSPVTRRTVYWNLMTDPSPLPANVVDRREVPLGHAKNVQMAKHMFLCSGVKPVYTKRGYN